MTGYERINTMMATPAPMYWEQTCTSVNMIMAGKVASHQTLFNNYFQFNLIHI